MTGAELIAAALRIARITAVGETASSDDQSAALSSLNLLLDAWSVDRLTVPVITDVSATMTGATSYTVQSGGSFNIAQPAGVEWAYFRLNGVDTPVPIKDSAYYAAEPDKSVAGQPEWLYWDGQSKVYPSPQPTSGDLHLGVWTALSQISDVSLSLTLKPGYLDALRYNLAVRICTEFGAPLPPDLGRHAAMSLARIKRANTRPLETVTDLSPVRRANILTGG